MAKKPSPAAAPRPLLYVKAGGPPANWKKIQVVLKSNGRKVPDVVEADAHEGWYDQAMRDKAGSIERDKVGRMRIRRVRAAIRLEVR